MKPDATRSFVRTLAGAAGLIAAWVALLLIVDVAFLGVRFESYVAAQSWWTLAAVVAFNGLVFLFVGLALATLLGRIAASFLLAAALYLFLGVASSLKLRHLGEPILPTDYLSLRQFSGMAMSYVALDPATTALVVLGVALLVGGCVLAWRERPASRAWLLAGLVVVGLPLFGLYFVANPATKPLGIVNYLWAQAYNLRSNGLLNHFALSLKPAIIVRPAGYGAGHIRDICAEPGPPVAGAQRKHVVLILNEAFTRIDRTLAAQVTFDRELAPFFASLGPTRLSVPTFGGLTANVEFEILTGTPMAFFAIGAIPYQQYIHRPQPTSLPALFKRAGYRTVALHPFARTFWNREPVYRELGFDRFIAIDDLKRPPGPPYVRDAELIAPIREILDAGGAPVFLFVLTMENHGPWFAPRYETFDVTVRKAPESFTLAALGALRNYAQGVVDADRFLEKLVTGLRGRDDVVVAMFGDHHPTLVVPDMGNTNLMSIRFGNPARKIPPEYDDRAILEPEIAFWPPPPPMRDEAQAMFLGSALAARAGVPLDGYWAYLQRLSNRFLMVQKRFVTTVDGTTTASGETPDLDDLRMLQYDILFGEQHAARHCTRSNGRGPAGSSLRN